jgi:hypothetical protein
MNLLFIINSTNIDPDVYRVGVVILIIIIGLAFLLTILRNILDHKLKNKMLDKGISDELVTSILQRDSQSTKNISIKWFLVLLATGIGLFITKRYLPLGIHSIGIMAVCIAVAFLGYSLYLNRVKK